MGFSQRIAWETLRSINSTTFNGTYQVLGTPLANPAYKVKMVNNSNVLVLVSIDGVNAVDVCPANSFWLYDETQSSVPPAGQSLSAGTQIYVNGAAGGTNAGLVYLVIQYII